MKRLLPIAMLACAGAASAATWDFTLSTSGEDVFWTSPTSVDPNVPGYDASYEITSVVANVSIFGIPTNIEAIDEVPVDLRSGSTVVGGPAPLVFFDETVAAPPPPEVASIAADVRIELDAMGFGQASATNVVLGSVTTNVPPFGDITVPLNSITFMGTITFTERATGPEDLDSDGSVGSGDLAILLAAWGACPATPPCPADFNNDGVVNSGDLAILLAAWG